MTNHEVKTAVAKRLRIDPSRSMADMIRAVESISGLKKGYRQNGRDYLSVWLGVKREYKPPVERINLMARKDYSWPKTGNPRADDIERSQPPFMTPRGAIGNGSENSPVWRR